MTSLDAIADALFAYYREHSEIRERAASRIEAAQILHDLADRGCSWAERAIERMGQGWPTWRAILDEDDPRVVGDRN